LGDRKGIRPVKNEWWGVGVVVCLERGADLHMAQLMPLSLAPVKSRLVLPFWYRLTQVILEKRPLNGCCYLTPALNSQGMKKLHRAIQKVQKSHWNEPYSSSSSFTKLEFLHSSVS